MSTRFALRLSRLLGAALLAAGAPTFGDDPTSPAAAPTSTASDPNGPVQGCANGSEDEGFFDA